VRIGKVKADYDHELFVDCYEEELEAEPEEYGDEFPDAYLWTCCGGNWKAPGCTVRKHNERPRKRARQ